MGDEQFSIFQFSYNCKACFTNFFITKSSEIENSILSLQTTKLLDSLIYD